MARQTGIRGALPDVLLSQGELTPPSTATSTSYPAIGEASAAPHLTVSAGSVFAAPGQATWTTGGVESTWRAAVVGGDVKVSWYA